ncbi:class I SAM-dependent methyltransferase [Acinetobacter pragensis]|uniref:S-adenosyl-L-methionine-dependent methyltransferase n=1 Tax=Acinetobacter pragensis TaxID=1806892 RepID=A0A151Y2K7_9GAMM|nr:class I SAM-dependent methyltransferase [Acinetobacter pragensis]KYQ72237.1 transferase [Acinetobacter pragensis]
MKSGRASKTAEAAAAIRANHYLYAKHPVFSDPYALQMTSTAWRSLLSHPLLNKALNSSFCNRTFGLLTAQVVARSRYAEERLFQAIEGGIRQYVLIGAGLDSFILRAAARYPELKIYEFDHPDTQNSKIKTLNLLGSIPNNVEFAPINFEHEKLSDALQRSGFDADQASFFSWLGTTHYLSPETTLATLQDISSFAAANSELVLDYSIHYKNLSGIERIGALTVSKFTHILSEPIIGAFCAEQLHQSVQYMGYRILDDLSGNEITARYFCQRADGIRHTQATHLLHLKIA